MTSPSVGPDSPILFNGKTREVAGLSNMYQAPFFLDGAAWRTTEHYYQASKFSDESIKEIIRRSETPLEALKLGRKSYPSFRRNWNAICLEVMYSANYAKFNQNSELKEYLLRTGNRELIEDSTDEFWGAGKSRNGANQLGKVLMKLRESLRNQSDIDLITNAKDFGQRLIVSEFKRVLSYSELNSAIIDGFRSFFSDVLSAECRILEFRREFDSCYVEAVAKDFRRVVWITNSEGASWGTIGASGIDLMFLDINKDETTPYVSMTVNTTLESPLAATFLIDDKVEFVHLRWHLNQDKSIEISCTSGSHTTKEESITIEHVEIENIYKEALDKFKAKLLNLQL
jgi:N-glycosidase YbiA